MTSTWTLELLELTSLVPVQMYVPLLSGNRALTISIVELILPNMTSWRNDSNPLSRGSMISSVGRNDTGWLFIHQTMVGVGIPTELQEILTDSPSSTDTTSLIALAYAATARNKHKRETIWHRQYSMLLWTRILHPVYICLKVCSH